MRHLGLCLTMSGCFLANPLDGIDACADGCDTSPPATAAPGAEHCIVDCEGRCGEVLDSCGETVDCDDGVQNGGETGIDCGGPVATCSRRCEQSTDCVTATDCESGYCEAGTCGDGHWVRFMGGEGSERYRLDDLALDSDGNIVIVGAARGPSALNGDPSQLGLHAQSLFAAKLDPGGNTLWSTRLATSADYGSEEQARVTVTDDGRIWVAGSYSGNLAEDGASAQGGVDAFAACLTPSGEVQAIQNLHVDAPPSLGGSYQPTIHDVVVATSGPTKGVYLAGEFRGTWDPSSSDSDGFVLQIPLHLDWKLSSSISTLSGPGRQEVRAIALHDEHVYASGNIDSELRIDGYPLLQWLGTGAFMLRYDASLVAPTAKLIAAQDEVRLASLVTSPAGLRAGGWLAACEGCAPPVHKGVFVDVDAATLQQQNMIPAAERVDVVANSNPSFYGTDGDTSGNQEFQVTRSCAAGEDQFAGSVMPATATPSSVSLAAVAHDHNGGLVLGGTFTGLLTTVSELDDHNVLNALSVSESEIFLFRIPSDFGLTCGEES